MSLSLLNLVEEALLISDQLESRLLKKEELGHFISDEVIADRIIQLKNDTDADPESCLNLRKITDILFQSAQTYKKAISPEQAKEAIKKLHPSFNTDFKQYVEGVFMENINHFIGDLRVHGFQQVIRQISQENFELTQENSALCLENQKLKKDLYALEEENKNLKHKNFSSAKAPTNQIAQALFVKRNLTITHEEMREDGRVLSPTKM